MGCWGVGYRDSDSALDNEGTIFDLAGVPSLHWDGEYNETLALVLDKKKYETQEFYTKLKRECKEARRKGVERGYIDPKELETDILTDSTVWDTTMQLVGMYMVLGLKIPKYLMRDFSRAYLTIEQNALKWGSHSEERLQYVQNFKKAFDSYNEEPVSLESQTLMQAFAKVVETSVNSTDNNQEVD